MKVWTASPGARLVDCHLSEPVSVSVDATLEDAAKRMRVEDISCVLVGEPGRVSTVLTERDVTDAIARSRR